VTAKKGKKREENKPLCTNKCDYHCIDRFLFFSNYYGQERTKLVLEKWLLCFIMMGRAKEEEKNSEKDEWVQLMIGFGFCATINRIKQNMTTNTSQSIMIWIAWLREFNNFCLCNCPLTSNDVCDVMNLLRSLVISVFSRWKLLVKIEYLRIVIAIIKHWKSFDFSLCLWFEALPWQSYIYMLIWHFLFSFTIFCAFLSFLAVFEFKFMFSNPFTIASSFGFQDRKNAKNNISHQLIKHFLFADLPTAGPT
jgi:hypothetical protein